MSTNADKLERAKALITEHIETNYEKLIGLGDGTAAVYCICKDLDILSDRMLVELARKAYNTIFKRRETEKAIKGDTSKMSPEEKDRYIAALKGELDFVKNHSLQILNEIRLATDILARENDSLRSQLASKKTTSKPTQRLFSRLLNLFRGKIPNNGKSS